MKKIEIDICSAERTKLLTLLKLRFQVRTFEFVAPNLLKYLLTYILDVLWCQPIKLIQVVSTSEFHEY